MTSAKPKTKLVPHDRKAHNQREYERLLAEVKSHLEHRSPGIWDWVTDTANKVKDSVSNAYDKVTSWASDTSKKIDDATGGAWETASAPIIKAGYDTGKAIDKGITAVGEWGKSVADKAGGFYDTAVDKIKEYVEDVVDRTDDYIKQGGSKTDDAWRKLADTAKDNLDRGGEIITNTFTTITEKLGDMIATINITLGVGMEAAWAALAGLPDALTQAFSINLEDFVEDGLKLYAANKALVERIKAEEGIE